MKPKCSECPFNGQRKIFGEGSRTMDDSEGQYDLAVVGMAPADVELRMGRPMVGPSGQVLRGTLHQLGIKAYYIANVLLCQITTDDDKLIAKAVECCKDRLIEEVLARKPKLTIALGDMPLHVFADTQYSIKEIEGRVIPCKVGLLLPITHPAFYWRRPNDAMDFIECMRAGVRVLEGRYQQAGDVTLTLVTKDNLEEVRNEILKYEFISVDLETSGFNPQGLKSSDEILEMGISVNNHHAYIVPLNLIPRFKDILETLKVIGWSLQFDGSFLKVLGITLNSYFDGLLAHYCMDERKHSHGLKRVARIYIGADDWEADIDKYLPHKKTSSYSLIPPPVRHVYLSKDACYAYQMREVLEEEVKNSFAFWNILMPSVRMFTDVMHRGILIDPEKMLNMYNVLTAEMDTEEKELWKLAGKYFNPKSYKDVGEIIYDDLRVPIDPRAGRSTDKRILESHRYQYEIIDRIIKYREMEKMVGTYIEGFATRLDKNFRVHPTIKLFGTVTGRLSSENPSIMNVPRTGGVQKASSRVKEVFLADKGRYLAEFDLDRAELVWYTIISGDEVLRKILSQENTPEDPHANDPHYLIGKIAYGEKEAMALRILVKAIVFGRLYLRGIGSVIEQVGREKAYRICDVMDSIMPKHRIYTNSITRQIHTKGYVESYFGRKRRYPMITEANRHEVERQAVNMPIQSSSSDLNLLCMLHLYSLRDKYDILPLFPVHDDIIVDIPSPDIIPVLKKELEDKAFEIVKGYMPIRYSVEWGKNWAMQK